MIINLQLAVFYRQSISCEVIDKSQGDLNSPNSKYCLVCPPWSISIVLLFFEVSTSIFCVLIRQRQSLYFVCFRIFGSGREGGREGGTEGGTEGGREGGRRGVGRVRESGGAESASPCSVEFRRLRVKVAECCRGHAALIPGGSKSVLST